MRIWRAVVVFSAALSITVTAMAQQGGSVMEHYRAYNAALERNDLPAAETAAAAAVAASEALGADERRLAVLLTNLAQVRLDSGRPADALAPAQRALALAEAQGADAQVNVRAARILVAHAAFLTNQQTNAAALQQLLDQSRGDQAVQHASFLASRDLATWAMRESRWETAIPAWTSFLDSTSADDPNAVIDRAAGYLGRGRAHAEIDIIDNANSPRIGSNVISGPDGFAERDYGEAQRLLRPLLRLGADMQPTNLHQLYATALASSNLLRARVRSLEWDVSAALEAQTRGIVWDMDSADGVPACRFRVYDSPRPRYPMQGSLRTVGSVVLWLRSDAQGRIVERRVLAVAGGQAYGEAVERVYDQWELLPADGYTEPCSKASAQIFPYAFVQDDVPPPRR